jgi:hypothetical protein
MALRRWVERSVAAHLELYLSGLAIATALVLPLLLELGTDVQELAGAALAACVVQGVLFWALRRRAQRIRLELIAEVRALLRDRINNQLQIVLFSLSAGGGSAEDDRERLALAIDAVGAVARTLDELSADSLRRWQHHYRETFSAVASSGGSAGDSGTGGSAAGK